MEGRGFHRTVGGNRSGACQARGACQACGACGAGVEDSQDRSCPGEAVGEGGMPGIGQELEMEGRSKGRG
jgi:hypothetical protein